MSILGQMHGKFVYNRRVSILASRLSALLPHDAQVIDVGCGDGMIDLLIMQQRPDVSISGIDTLVRDRTGIPVSVFDGHAIPYKAQSFDAVMFVDVLHHTDNPEGLLQEAKRVSRDTIIIKDHTKDGMLAGLTLRLMDWVGNIHHGVALPYNYWTERQWRETFVALDFTIQSWDAQVCLYPWPATLFFDRSLHFIAKLVQH
jgi:SAM-dependent methyltransferase